MITRRAGRVKHVVSTAVDKSGLAQLSVKHSGAGNGLKKNSPTFLVAVISVKKAAH